MWRGVKSKTPELHTEHLRLRAFEPADTEAYHRVLSDPKVATWLGRPEGFSEAETLQWIHGFSIWWDRHGYAPWAVVAKGEIVGHCGLRFAEDLGEVELMYAIRSDNWGKGIATEASRAALQFASDSLHLPRVVAYTLRDNQASQAVMQNLGFEFTRELEHANLPHVLYTKTF